MKIRYITLTQIIGDNKYLPIEYGGYIDMENIDAKENNAGVISIKCNHSDLNSIEVNWENDVKLASLGECKIVVRDDSFCKAFRANVVMEKLFNGYSVTISPLKTS